MNQPDPDPALATTATPEGASHAAGMLSDAEVKRLGDLNQEFYPAIRDAVSYEAKERAREEVRQQVEKLLTDEGHLLADVFAHAVVHDYVLADAKYRVMLDLFNGWVKRIAEPPRQFGRFKNIKRLGADGFGVVFQADDTRRLDEHGNPIAVAIKLPHAPYKLDDRRTAREPGRQIANFFLEARRHAGITVTRCVSLLNPDGLPDDAAEGKGLNVDAILRWLRKQPLWFSMQLIRGRSLGQVLDPETYKPGETLEFNDVIKLMTEVAESLRDMHAKKIPGTKNDYFVHKDLKPSNILLDEQGTPWLTDFGLATPRAEQPVFGNPISGTFEYMAPEIWEGRDADPRTDVWAWGVIFYELLAGHRPFIPDERAPRHEQIGQLRTQILGKDPDSLRRQPTSRIDRRIEDIILRCLRRDRTERFGSFRDIVEALQAPAVPHRIAAELIEGFSRVEDRIKDALPQVGGPLRNRRQSKDFSLLDKVKTGPDLFGREKWIDRFSHFLRNPQTRILVLHAFGGFGKTALAKEWKNRLARDGWGDITQAFGYSFYGQGQHSTYVGSQEFLTRGLLAFGDPDPTAGEAFEKVDRLVNLVCAAKTLLVVDGVEVLQNPPQGDRATELRDGSFHEFLLKLIESNFSGLCLITTRFPSESLRRLTPAIEHLELPRLELPPARDILNNFGVRIDTLDLDGGSASDRLIEEFAGHPLSLMLVGNYISLKLDGDPRRRSQIPRVPAEEQCDGEYQHNHSHRVIRAYEDALRAQGSDDELRIVDLLSVFDRPVEASILRTLACSPCDRNSRPLGIANPARFESALETLQRYQLLSVDAECEADDRERFVDMHPLIRSFFRSRLKTRDVQGWKRWNRNLYRLLLSRAPQRLSSLETSVSSRPRSAILRADATTVSLSHARDTRERQFEAASLLTEAIRHDCEAGCYWEAFAVLMARLDQQLQPVPEWGLKSLFAVWRVLTSSSWSAAATTFGLRSVLNSVFWLRGVLQRSPQVDTPVNLYAAKRLQAWELRLSCVSHFYPEQNFQCPPCLEEGIASSVFDLITSYTLVHVGRTNEATVIARRVHERFAATGIRLFTYVAASGVALLELYVGHLPAAVCMAEEALRVAQTPQQRADALAMRAFALDLQGEADEAQRGFESAFRLVPRLSTRCTYLHWKRLIRRGDLQQVSERFEREVRSGPSADNAGAHLDWNTMARNVRLHLDYRRAVDALELSPSELLNRVEHAYDDLSDHFHAGFHHRTMMQFHRARALTLCALLPDAEEGNLTRAEAALNSALRHARTGGFRMVEVDALVQLQRLLAGIGRDADAAEVRAVATEIATEIGYTWGLEDLNREGR